MANTSHEQIDKSVPIGDISLGMKRLRASDLSVPTVSRAVKKLGFIHLRYKDFSVKEASSIIGVTVQTGYRWQREWNRSQMDSIIPEFKGGRKSSLTSEQKSILKRILSESPSTTKEAQSAIEDAFGISYSEKQVHVILSSMGLRHVSMPSTGSSGNGRRRMRWII
ncbi:MAG: transposase [Candidatus Methanomethylophilaceae archaeon]|nr:transposase [Candidatus Methanomethylophilaceae archaeon]